MFIANDYINEYKPNEKLSNQDYLLRHIWLIDNTFNNELALIKNNRCEFIAFTEKMAVEFNLNKDILGKTFNAATDIPQEVKDGIHQQELRLLAEQRPQNSFYFFKKNQEIRNYFVRKRPLVNPATSDSVGILVVSGRAHPNFQRKFIMQRFLGLSKHVLAATKPELGALQQQILFCLLLGINNRKEIASTLTNITGKETSENQIKNALQGMYSDFNCSNYSQLVSLTLNGQIPFEIPDNTIPLGNYLITQSL